MAVRGVVKAWTLRTGTVRRRSHHATSPESPPDTASNQAPPLGCATRTTHRWCAEVTPLRHLAELFEEAHPVDIIGRTITGDAYDKALKGPVDPKTLPAKGDAKSKKKLHAEVPVLTGKPPLDAVINIFDFESIARTEMLNNGKKEG